MSGDTIMVTFLYWEVQRYAGESNLVCALPSHPQRIPPSGDGPRQIQAVPRMGLTEEPTRVWEVGEPVPFEIPEPCCEPAVPEHEPARV